MYQLLYVSKETSPLSDDHLESILKVSRENNNRDQITGFLAYLPNGVIIQVLEGEKKSVHRTYERIAKDTRHTNATIISEHESDNRQFLEWSMGFRKLSQAEAKALPGFIDLRDGKTLARLGDGPTVITLLKSILVANEIKS